MEADELFNLCAACASRMRRTVVATLPAIANCNTSLSLVTAGTERLVVGTTGGVGIGQQPASGVALAVSGSTNLCSDSTVSGTLTLSENPNTRLRAAIQAESSSTDLT